MRLLLVPAAAVLPLVGWAAVAFPGLFGGPLVVLSVGFFAFLAGMMLPRRLDLFVIAWWLTAVAVHVPPMLPEPLTFRGWYGPTLTWFAIALAAGWWLVAFWPYVTGNWRRMLPRLPRQKVPAMPRSRRSPAKRIDLQQLEVATRDDGARWRIPFMGYHVLVVGETNAGKGSVEWSMVKAIEPAIRDGLVQVYAIDPKVAELGRGRNLWHRWIPGRGDWLVKVAEALEEVRDEMEARQEKCLDLGVEKITEPTRDMPLIVVLIDEFVRITATVQDRQLRDRIEGALIDITSNARAYGITVVACTQAPQKEILGKVRDFFPVKVCMRVGSARIQQIVLGEDARDGGAEAWKIPLDKPGTAYVWDMGREKASRVRFDFVSNDDIKALNSGRRAETHSPEVDAGTGVDVVESEVVDPMAELSADERFVHVVRAAWPDGEEAMHMDELATVLGMPQAQVRSGLEDAGVTVVRQVQKKRAGGWRNRQGVRLRHVDDWLRAREPVGEGRL